jgi:hypothetical protein
MEIHKLIGYRNSGCFSLGNTTSLIFDKTEFYSSIVNNYECSNCNASWAHNQDDLAHNDTCKECHTEENQIKFTHTTHLDFNGKIENDVDAYLHKRFLRSSKTYTSSCFEIDRQMSTAFSTVRFIENSDAGVIEDTTPISFCWKKQVSFSHEIFRFASLSFTLDFLVSNFDNNGNPIKKSRYNNFLWDIERSYREDFINRYLCKFEHDEQF